MGVKERPLEAMWLTVTSVLEEWNVPLVCELKSKNAESERQHMCVTRRDTEDCVLGLGNVYLPMVTLSSPSSQLSPLGGK